MFPTTAKLLRNAASPTLSFEFFPPRTPGEQPRFGVTVVRLGRFHPVSLSVTYGTSDSTRDRTAAATVTLRSAQHAVVVDHLTCVSQSTNNLLRTLDTSVDVGVSDTLVTREGMPGGSQQPWERHPGRLGNATELVRLIKAHGDFRVGVAAFPNVHQPDNDLELDVRTVVERAAVGADYAITQLFFKPHRYVELVSRVRERSSQTPIIPGIVPLTVVTQIERPVSLADCPLPKDFIAALRTARNPAEVRSIGLSRAVNPCRKLLAAGAPGLQFFTQSRQKAISEVLGVIGWGDRVS